MQTLEQQSKDYKRIEKAIYFLSNNIQRQPTLAEVAKYLGMSPFHFQKMFQRWAGVSPKTFLQFLTKEHAKQLLKRSNILNVSYESGLSGPGRLHDLFIKFEAMTPGEYKNKGEGITIDYGIHPTYFGECLIALTDRGVCSLVFIDQDNPNVIVTDLRKKWSKATFRTNPARTKKYIDHIFHTKRSREPVSVIYRGTDFQTKVWEALLKIPHGSVVTYQTIAKSIGHPKAVRAVGTAIGNNPVAYLIPCHRVIRGLGHLGGYRWGLARKQAMLAIESTYSS